MLGKKIQTVIRTVLLLTFASTLTSLVFAQNPIISESLTLTVYFDGYVQVANVFEINQTYPQIVLDLLTFEPQSLLFVDEQDTLLDYSILDIKATVFSLGASQIKASYFAPDLTFKTGKFWTLALNASTNTVIILPTNSSIISLNKVPDRIESLNDQITIEMSSGQIEISYITDHVLQDQDASFDYLPLILIFSIIATLVFGLAFKFLRTDKIEKSMIAEKVLDTEKLFNQHKYLRDEEIQVIRFLGENNATAYEAQIYEKLNLPRTTTWRLLKRLQKMEIINIEKSRRQNIISIRKKYLKKNKSQK
jgi:uncharacterized membrane protein